jgi:hypothetical protein
VRQFAISGCRGVWKHDGAGTVVFVVLQKNCVLHVKLRSSCEKAISSPLRMVEAPSEGSGNLDKKVRFYTLTQRAYCYKKVKNMFYRP